MKKLLSFGALLLFAGSIAAQQQAPPAYNPPPPYVTPPTFPQEQKPTDPMPPDTKAPPPENMPTADVQEQIQKKLAAEPLLAKTDVMATVDANNVVLSGTVENEQQHDLALHIAQSYAGSRKVIDKVKLRQRT